MKIIQTPQQTALLEASFFNETPQPPTNGNSNCIFAVLSFSPAK